MTLFIKSDIEAMGAAYSRAWLSGRTGKASMDAACAAVEQKWKNEGRVREGTCLEKPGLMYQAHQARDGAK